MCPVKQQLTCIWSRRLITILQKRINKNMVTFFYNNTHTFYTISVVEQQRSFECNLVVVMSSSMGNVQCINIWTSCCLCAVDKKFDVKIIFLLSAWVLTSNEENVDT